MTTTSKCSSPGCRIPSVINGTLSPGALDYIDMDTLVVFLLFDELKLLTDSLFNTQKRLKQYKLQFSC